MNEAIKEMKATPGIYLVGIRPVIQYAKVEVTDDGKVFQLDLAGNRSGELSDDGWSEQAFVLSSVVFKQGE